MMVGALRLMVLATVILIAIQAAALFYFGQPSICECGYIKSWEGVVKSAGNSQHLTDWYTFSHIIHGFLFYLFTWWLFPKMALWQRFAIALGIEVAWEITENTPWLIEHYREQALAQGYVGDSIINSLFDSLAMVLGFFLALRWPVWLTVAVALYLEIFVGAAIRDNLTLNVLNFIYPLEFIHEWQSGAP